MSRSCAFALSIALFVLAAPRVARGDVVDRCVDASERGQHARRATKLLEARSLFVACAAASCPGAVRSACSEWLSAVEASIPSIVVGVEADGADLASARVLLDDAPVAQGTAVAVDPGAHRIKAAADGFTPTTLDVVAREGELRRAVRVKLSPTPASPTAAAPNAHDSGEHDRAERAPSPPEPPSAWGPPLAGVIAFGVAVVAGGVGVIYGVRTLGARDDFDANPTTATRDAFYDNRLVANVGFFTAGAAAIVGGVIWVVAPRERASPVRSGFQSGLLGGAVRF